jgi:hypothetical protein
MSSSRSEVIQDLIDDILAVYERLVLTDVEGETVELYLAATELCQKAEMFGEDRR